MTLELERWIAIVIMSSIGIGAIKTIFWMYNHLSIVIN